MRKRLGEVIDGYQRETNVGDWRCRVHRFTYLEIESCVLVLLIEIQSGYCTGNEFVQGSDDEFGGK